MKHARSRPRKVALVVAVACVVVAGLVVLAVRGRDTSRASTAPSASMSMDMSMSPSTRPSTSTTAPAPSPVDGYPGMPPVIDPSNIYSEIAPGHVPASLSSDLPRVYVPNGKSDTVSVIDPTTKTVIGSFPTGREPQHVVPSYDLRTLWVLDNQGNDVIPIDPTTGQPGSRIPVADPYNLYFTPDGSAAIVVAEARRRLDFRDPHTMQLMDSLEVPECAGINHADYDANGSYLIVTCEFSGMLAKIDVLHRQVLGTLDLSALSLPGQPHPDAMRMPDGESASAMPQDVRATADGHHFYVADMLANGVFVIDGDSFTATQFIPTGIGTHGLYPSRDGRSMYVANRGSNMVEGTPHGPGSVSVVDMKTNAVVATWDIPGGGSPDMGNLTADGTELWLSGRYDSEVYVFDTVHGGLETRIPVGAGPHGLTVWPQAGRYSLGHTGNMR